MAVTWYWNHILGELTRKSEYDGKPYKTRLLGGGNVLCVMAIKANADDDGRPYKKPVWTVYCEFFSDEQHMRNCLGLNKKKRRDGKPFTNLYENATKLKLNAYYWKEVLPIAKAFVEVGVTVEFYNKPPKGDKNENPDL